MQRIPPERITQAVALLLTGAILWNLLGLHRTDPPPPDRDPGVQLSLAQEPPAPTPAPQPEKPRPRVVPVRHQPAPAPVPEPAPIIAPPVDSPDEPVIAQAEPAEPAPPAPSHASIEAAYAAALRQIIESRTRPPDTAEYRMLRPAGEAQVRFVLDRGGALSQVAIYRTSGSHILDRQALSIVSQGQYPPFPEGAFPGETRHLFLVKVEFRS